MFANTAYLNNSLNEIVDFSTPLAVTSCGFYQIHSGPSISTNRPKGRNDYQLIYIESGQGYFTVDSKEYIIDEGSVVLYRPHEPQIYHYYGKNKTNIYWTHFSGNAAENIITHYGFPANGNFFNVGVSHNLPILFKQIISEMQLCNEKFREMAALKLHEILLTIYRSLNNPSKLNDDTFTLIKQSRTFFNENYNKNISVSTYAKSINMTPCWFIKKFKELFGVTPAQYILELRLTTAKNLLLTSACNISEIALAIGYDNPLYFSRVFTKHTELSPSKYKKINKQ